MRIIEKDIKIKRNKNIKSIIQDISNQIINQLGEDEVPIRFAITSSTTDYFFCEVNVIQEISNPNFFPKESIFSFHKREFQDIDTFNAVLLIPTGIGAEIGGFCGDGNAVAKFLASACDTLITHPNVVNASDINEMTNNTLYVEGSIISRLLTGQIGLQTVKNNKTLILMDTHLDKLFNDEVVNAVSAARVTLGLSADVIELKDIIDSTFSYTKFGSAAGEINKLERLFEVIEEFKDSYDTIGLSTFIKVPTELHKDYFVNQKNMVNPWGGIEAMLTHSIAEVFNIQCAHSPMMSSREIMDMEVGIVDPRKASETSSITYLHCILKGLQKAPKIVSKNKGLTVENISCLIIPDKCIGLPTLAALEQGIPVIAVKENACVMKNNLRELPFSSNNLIIVDNYLEAAGVMTALKAGVSLESIRRPIKNTKVSVYQNSKTNSQSKAYRESKSIKVSS